MTRQSINLLGAVMVVAIVLAGLLVAVLPRLDQAGQSRQDRDSVALQNQTQQTLISAYAAQRKQLPALQAQVGTLKQQIASGPHLEQLIEVAARLPAGAVLRSITPGQPGESGTAGSTPSAAASTSPSPSTPSATAGFQALPVTMEIGLRQPGAAAAVLDGLRAGPRLFAIDHVTLSASSGSAKDTSSTLTVAGRVFMKEGGQ